MAKAKKSHVKDSRSHSNQTERCLDTFGHPGSRNSHLLHPQEATTNGEDSSETRPAIRPPCLHVRTAAALSAPVVEEARKPSILVGHRRATTIRGNRPPTTLKGSKPEAYHLLDQVPGMRRQRAEPIRDGHIRVNMVPCRLVDQRVFDTDRQ